MRKSPLDAMDSEASELMSEALVGAGTSVWAWDLPQDVLTGMNGSVALLGYAPGELESTQSGWNAVIHPDDLPDNDAAYLTHAAGQLPSLASARYSLSYDGVWPAACVR